MYHRVVPRRDLNRIYSHPGIVIETGTFESHLQTLRRYLRVISLDEFERRMIAGQPFRDRTCLITFDDGWQDNFTEAFPLLVRYGLPAAIFLPVGFVGTGRRFWQETLSDLLFHALTLPKSDRQGISELAVSKLGLDLDELIPDETGKARIQEKVSKAKALSEHELQSILDKVSAESDRNFDWGNHLDTFLTWEQVKTMAGSKIRFGSHTVNHMILTKVPLDLATEEVGSSMRAIEIELGQEVVAFSYPNGNYDAEIKEAVVTNGYQLAFTTQAGVVSAEDDRFTIRRVNIHEGAACSKPLFLARIVGIF
jgi:peptidoglycan/xylan/chitin deacetylase (PgdA/CDA1 family)